MLQLDGLAAAGNTVVIVEHEMRVVAVCDWVIDMGAWSGGTGGKIVARGTPVDVAKVSHSRTAPYLAAALEGHSSHVALAQSQNVEGLAGFTSQA